MSRWTNFSQMRWLAAIAGVFATVGCARSPSPLAPNVGGSVGAPSHGVLTSSTELPKTGEGYKCLRDDDRHHGIPRFVDAIGRAAKKVSTTRSGGTLGIGDLSVRNGGRLMPHFSHRTGRDADLLFYVTSLEGAPIESPGFVHFGADGLAWDATNKRFIRFDVEREWLLVRALLEDPEARIQWVFVSRTIEAVLLEWARARGEPLEIIARASEVMLQPNPGGVHDDHIHIRTACSPEEIAGGCEPTGPVRSWIAAIDAARVETPASVTDLVAAIAQPIESSQSTAAGVAAARPGARQ